VSEEAKMMGALLFTAALVAVAYAAGFPSWLVTYGLCSCTYQVGRLVERLP
jgi:hypothetical protein